MTTTTPHTLQSLTDIFKAATVAAQPATQNGNDLRKIGVQAVLDAIGFNLPVDPEREAFNKWAEEAGEPQSNFLFTAWKAGRAMLRESMEKQRHSALDEIIPQTAKQPENDGWIPWSGGECPVNNLLRVQVQYREIDFGDTANAGSFRWNHVGKPSDIIAYKIVTP